MLIYGCGSIVGAIFVLLATKETSGQRIDDIDEYVKTDRKREESNIVSQPDCPLILQQKNEQRET